MHRHLTRAIPMIAGLSFALAGPTAARAEDFPARPLRVVLPVGAGSSSDLTTRFIAQRLGDALRQPVVVENRPGGETLVATNSVLGAPADGYTILGIGTALLTAPLMNPAAQYDPKRDVRPIVITTRGSAMIITAVNSKYTTVSQLLADARTKPGTVSLATYGQSFRIGIAQIEQQAKVKFNEILYKAISPAMTDVIGGSVDAAFADSTAALQLIKSGKVKALAVTSATRLAKLPEVPTLRESGLADFDFYVWSGYGVRSQTPEPVARRLEDEIGKIVRSPAYRAFVAERSDADVLGLTGQEAVQEVAREDQRGRKAVADLRREKR